MKLKSNVKSLSEIKSIIEEVVNVNDLSENCRFREYTFGRYIFFRIAMMSGYSANQIARFIEKRQHGTVLHGIEQHRLRLVDNGLYKKWYYQALDKVRGVEQKGADGIPQKILNKLNLMSSEQLIEFDKFRLDPYLKSLQIL